MNFRKGWFPRIPLFGSFTEEVRAYQSGNNLYSDVNLHVLPINVEDWDVANKYDNATYTWTPSEGKYIIQAMFSYRNVSGNTYINFRLDKNGTEELKGVGQGVAVSSTDFTCWVVGQVSANGTDTFQFTVQSPDASYSVYGGRTKTFFSLCRYSLTP